MVPTSCVFLKRIVFTRFDILKIVITNNWIQFTSRRFWDLLEDKHVVQNFTSIEYPYINGQVEFPNRVLLRGHKWRLDNAKKNRRKGFPNHSSTKKTPLWLTYWFRDKGIKLKNLAPFIKEGKQRRVLRLSHN